MSEIPHVALEGYEPAPGLLPIAPKLAENLVFRPGERVAFREDHPEFGSTPSDAELAPDQMPRRAAYGLIQAIGFDAESGDVKLDVRIFDPFHGLREEDTDIRRIGMEEIQ